MEGLRALWRGANAGSADVDGPGGGADVEDETDDHGGLVSGSFDPPRFSSAEGATSDNDDDLDVEDGDAHHWERIRMIAEAPAADYQSSSSLSSPSGPVQPLLPARPSWHSRSPNESALMSALAANDAARLQLRRVLQHVEAALHDTHAAQQHIRTAVTDEFRAHLTLRADYLSRSIGPNYFVGVDASTPAPNVDCDPRHHRAPSMHHTLPMRWLPDDCARLARGVQQQNQLALLAGINAKMVALEQQIPDAAQRVACPEFGELRKEMDRVQSMTPRELELGTHGLDWSLLSQRFLPDRTPDECRMQWLSVQHPSVNHSEWTADEDARLILLAHEHHERDWALIARELGTGRSALQCLERHRVKHSGQVRTRWTVQEDARLREAVRRFGEKNWQQVANALEGRSGQSCLHRWQKALHPLIVRGRWRPEEDERLREAVQLYGPQNWVNVQRLVQGRTDVQCRERWINVLDPALNAGPWTPEEDKRIIELVEKYGAGKWSEIAKEMPSRNDNIIWRRWKRLIRDSQQVFSDYNVFRRARVGGDRSERREVRYTRDVSAAECLQDALAANFKGARGENTSRVVSQRFRPLPPTDITCEAFKATAAACGLKDGVEINASYTHKPAADERYALFQQRFRTIMLWPALLGTTPAPPLDEEGEEESPSKKRKVDKVYTDK